MAHVEPYRLKGGARRYRARWEGPDGRDRSRTFLVKRDAERFVLELHRQAALGGLYQAPTQPLGEFLDGWLVRYERRVRQSSADRVRDVLPHLSPFRRTTLDALRPADVEDHISALSARAPRQAELALRVLKQVLSDAKVRGLTANEALFRIRAPHHEPREMRFLSWGEVDQLATNTIEPYGNLVRLAALTGLRQGELFALLDRNLDLGARTLTVEAGVYAGQLVPVKTRASRRRVDLAEAAISALRAQLAARRPSPLGLVFASPQGEILNDDNFRHRIFAPAVRRSRVGPVRFHDLRHTYATLMVAAGAHAKYLQAQMGHASIRVTLDLYGHLYPDANRTVLRELDRLIDPPGLEL